MCIHLICLKAKNIKEIDFGICSETIFIKDAMNLLTKNVKSVAVV
jgi:hypothetical protein